MSEESSDLERRISDLEWRLSVYHEALEESLAHNQKFQLSASWGIVKGTAFFVLVGGAWLLNKLWRDYVGEDPSWVVSIGLFLVAAFGWYKYAGYVEKGHQDDERRLYRLPEWNRPK